MNKYEIILNVCETRSISKTASDLNYTQSAISQSIKNFETELGLPIFKRSKKGMELLPNTEDIVESLKIICQEKHRMKQIASSLACLDSGYIRIGTIQSIAYHWLPAILKHFSTLYPHIHFTLEVNGFNELRQKLDENKLDCIFTSQYSVPNYPFIPITHDELMLVTPKKHPLADKLTVSVINICNQDFLLSSDKLDYETGKILEMNKIHPHIRYHFNDDYAVCKMVEQGFGITILPKLLLHDIPFDICIRSFTEHYSRILGVAYAKDSTTSPATSKFLDYIRDWAKEHSDSDTTLALSTII